VDLGIDGRVALVTGASRGIGNAIARALAAEGANVALASRSRERIDAAAAGAGGRGFVYDSADLDGALAMVDEVEAELGPIDILVVNTGGPPVGPDPLGFTREQWEKAYRDLLLGPMELVQRVIPGMRERGFGRVLGVSSSAVREPISAIMLSNAHRTGTLAAWKTIAREVAVDGVTVNTLLPGRIGTERLAETLGSMENAEALAEHEVPAKRLGTPDEMGAAAAFLCSQQAAYITGVALLVDGGLTRGIY